MSVQKYVIVQPLFAFLLFVLHLIYMLALRFQPNADRKMLNLSRFLHFLNFIFSQNLLSPNYGNLSNFTFCTFIARIFIRVK